jgi:hypothetical protein
MDMNMLERTFPSREVRLIQCARYEAVDHAMLAIIAQQLENALFVALRLIESVNLEKKDLECYVMAKATMIHAIEVRNSKEG